MLIFRKSKIHQTEIIFIVAYICFFCSIFIGDLGIEMENIAQLLRYISYFCSMLQLFIRREKQNDIIFEGMIFIISFLFVIYARDFYISMLLLLIVGSRDTTESKICNISLFILIVGTIITVFGCLVGIIPDIMTSEAFSTELTRHSYGFYHSNVLPNNLVIIELLIVWKEEKHVNYILILLFEGLHILVFFLVHSRMSLLVGSLLSIGILFMSLIHQNKKVKNTLYNIANMLLIMCVGISFLLVGIYPYSKTVEKIDLFFSNRFWTALLKIKNLGLYLLNFKTNKDFYSDGIIVDNGYLFLAIRYGLIVLIFVLFILLILIKKNRDNVYKLICLICVIIIAFIDNLFLSYRFLPFLIIVFLKERSQNTIIKK